MILLRGLEGKNSSGSYFMMWIEAFKLHTVQNFLHYCDDNLMLVELFKEVTNYTYI